MAEGSVMPELSLRSMKVMKRMFGKIFEQLSAIPSNGIKTNLKWVESSLLVVYLSIY